MTAQTRSTPLRLRPLRLDDELEFRDAYLQMSAEGLNFGPAMEPGMTWRAYLERLDDFRHGRNLPPRYVPSSFLVADVAGAIVGRTSIVFS